MENMHEESARRIGRDIAHAKLDADVRATWPNAAALSKEELIARFPERGHLCGWRLPREEVGSDRDLLLLIPELFPYAVPRVALAARPEPAQLPHVELDGSLCLLAAADTVRLPADIELVRFLVEQARITLDESARGANTDDFLNEVATYWALGVVPKGIPFWFVSSDLRTSRQVAAVPLDEAIVIGDSEQAVADWLQNQGRLMPRRKFEKAVLVHLPKGPLPNDYPATSGDVIGLIQSAGRKAVEALSKCVAPGKRTHVLLSFDVGTEPAIVGATVPVGTKVGGNGKNRPPLWQGFRPNKVPPNVLLSRVAGAKYRAHRTTVVRVDGRSLLTRTTGAGASTLSAVRVAVIGCGALGATVARLLATAGIRKLLLIDGETLAWQNVGRHELSGRQIGQNKAVAMQAAIRARIPDAEVVAVQKQWQEEWTANPAIFDQCDLVVSMTGNWQSDCLLNRLTTQGGDVPPVIFGWVEAQALAGHALAVMPKGGCLQCVTDATGAFGLAVASVPEPHGNCESTHAAAFYQPFSAMSASPAAAMVAVLVRDAVRGRLDSRRASNMGQCAQCVR